MKSLITAAVLAASAAVAAPAFAQQAPAWSLAPVTYEGSVAYTGIDSSGIDLGAVTFHASAFFGPYVGVEGEGAFGVVDKTASFGGSRAKLHLNDEYAGYGVARYPVLPNANLFVRVGYGHSDLHASATTPSFSADATGGVDSVNFGAGGNYFFDGKNGLRVDYTRFDFQGHSGLKDADTWSVGYVRRFF